MIHPDCEVRPLARLLGAALAAALLVGLVAVGPAGAALSDICPAPGQQDDRFGDDDNDVHEANIDCAAAYGMVRGTSATTFDPRGTLRRGQAASIIVQYVEISLGRELTSDTTQSFPDTAGTTHEANIEKAADNDLLAGFGDGTFRPTALITRGQLASVVVAATELALGRTLVSDGTDDFDDDDGSVHEVNIEKAADNGILLGTGARRFDPGAPALRGQMASIVIRAAGNVLFPEDAFAPAIRDVSATARPELQQASIVGTVTAGQVTPTNPLGTTVRFVFDERLAASATVEPHLAGLQLYDADGRVADDAAESAEVDGNAVVARFEGVATTEAAASLTLATVTADAVADTEGLVNPEGDAAIGTPSSGAALAAGITGAPDLLGVRPLHPAAVVGTTAVDFSFDEPAFVVSASGFKLVLPGGSEVTCAAPAAGSPAAGSGGSPGGGTSPGGNGTTAITVTCPNPDGTDADTTSGGATDPQVSDTNVARGTVDDGTVSDAQQVSGVPVEGRANPLQAVALDAVAVNAGNTSQPDLVSVEPRPGATATANDEALFTFDQPVVPDTSPVVSQRPVPASFALYTVDGRRFAGASVVVSPSNRATVLVTFGVPIATDDAVGGNVRDGAVFLATADGTPTEPNATANQQDEEGFASTAASPTRTPGRTAAPDLTGVVLARGPADALGNQGSVRAVYSFDEDVVVVAQTRFVLYLADGTRLVSTACTAGTAEDVDHTVTCTAFNVGTTAATQGQLASATLGTVDSGAVAARLADNSAREASVDDENPEGAEPTTNTTAA